MPPCPICIHPLCGYIDRELALGVSIDTLVSRYQVSSHALQKHEPHVPAPLCNAGEAAELEHAASRQRLTVIASDLRREYILATRRGERAHAIAALRAEAHVVTIAYQQANPCLLSFENVIKHIGLITTTVQRHVTKDLVAHDFTQTFSGTSRNNASLGSRRSNSARPKPRRCRRPLLTQPPTTTRRHRAPDASGSESPNIAAPRAAGGTQGPAARFDSSGRRGPSRRFDPPTTAAHAGQVPQGAP